jgi:thioredoxin-like negative regulator of GroEL
VADRSSASIDEATVPTLIEVWAPWCSACKAMEGDLLDVAGDHAGRVRLEQVNAAEDADRAKALSVMATPTLIGYHDGVEVFRSTGRASRSELEDLFRALEAGEPAPQTGRTESILAIGAGATLLAASAITGMSLGLAAIGIAVLSFGAVRMLRRWYADRS